ncbi:hypothetical protein GCM10027176_68100 [Actinoallomurus bryophytorum]|uniref:RICIN domain-containing protein n=1 Tax=Actinoallomurus bryophytorum TaxID=1490222 RepID=UPI00163AB304|nr:RICIN domain-containing protein [Actinoallomurus bryophytorum]
MSEQNSTERQRQERAEFVDAFNKRAWQPGERPRQRLRFLAGGIAVIVAAGVAYGAGVLDHYDHRKAAKNRERELALTARAGQAPTPAPTSPYAMPWGTTTPSSKPPASPALPAPKPAEPGTKEKKRTVFKAESKGGRRPAGPKFSTARDLLLMNVVTGKCADVPGNGDGTMNGPVVQHTCRATAQDNQRWDLVVRKNGAGPNGADLFTIRNSKDGLCFDLRGSGAVDRVTEWRCASGGNQLWYLDEKHSGEFWIRDSGDGGKCLDVEGARAEDASLTAWPCDPKDDHLWVLKPAN